MAQRSSRRAITLRTQAQGLHQDLQKVMRSLGRQCRGQGHGFVKRVRHTARQRLDLGYPITVLGPQA